MRGKSEKRGKERRNIRRESELRGEKRGEERRNIRRERKGSEKGGEKREKKGNMMRVKEGKGERSG